MRVNQSQKKLIQVIFTALFAAVCYVALFFKIPVPSPVGNPFLHLGNLFVILAALLISGPVGGIAGSLGMGLFDVTQGYATYAPKTIVLKLGIGLVAGFVYSKGRKENAKSPVGALALSSLVLLSLGAGLFILRVYKGYEVFIEGMEKSLAVSPALYIFSFVLGFLLLAAAIFAKKLPVKLQYAFLAAVCGIFFNVVGEFLLGAVYHVIMQGSAWPPAFIASAISLPATIINGTFSVAGAVALYIPLEKAFAKSGTNIR